MEKPKTVEQTIDQRFTLVRQQILARQQLFAASGVLVADFKQYRGRRLGPYYRLAFRDAGCQRSIYLGRSEPLARRVGLLLEELKRPFVEQQCVRRLRARLRAELRRQKNLIEQQLAPYGFRMKGFAFHRRKSD